MKNIILLFFISYSFSLSAQTTGDQIFDNNFVHEIRIESDDTDLIGTLYDDFFIFFDQILPYHLVKVSIDGVVLDSVGIRIKGQSSALETKKPLKLDFNRFVSGQNYDGLKKLNLHNAMIDKSMQREHLAYSVFKDAGVKGSRTAFTQVFVNDVLQGVYLIVEQIDKTLFDHYFASDKGTIYKDKNNSNGVVVVDETGTLDEYNELLDVVTNTPSSELKNKLDTILHTDAYLKYILALNITNTVDNALHNYNFWMYHEPKSSLLYWVPWDLNLSLMPFANFDLDFDTFNPFFKAMMNVPEYRDRYHELACEILDYNFTTERLHNIIDINVDLIRDLVEVDPKIEFTIEEFDAETQILKDLIVSRRNDFQEDLNNLNFTCSNLTPPISPLDIVINEFMASNDSTSNITDPAGSHPDWIELYNNTNADISLDKFYLSDDVDFLKHWAFPKNTILPANEYLIVWADRDVDEIGLHTDFKLNKNAGQLFLVYEDLSIIDSITYSDQLTNISLARVPNGTGEFVQRSATFNGNNNPTSTDNFSSKNFDLQIFPNPSDGFLNIKFKEKPQQVLTIKVVDVFGNILCKEFMTNNRSTVLDIHHLPSGLYWLEISSVENHFSKKLIIQH